MDDISKLIMALFTKNAFISNKMLKMGLWEKSDVTKLAHNEKRFIGTRFACNQLIYRGVGSLRVWMGKQ